MNWLQKGVFCKQEIFSENALKGLLYKDSLFLSVSETIFPALLAAVKFAVTRDKGELRKSLMLLSFLLLLFITFIFTRIFLIFLRFLLNLILSNPTQQNLHLPASIVIIIYLKNTAIVK